MTVREMTKISKLLEKISEELDWLSLPSQDMEKKIKDKIHTSINEVANICQDSVTREIQKVSKKK